MLNISTIYFYLKLYWTAVIDNIEYNIDTSIDTNLSYIVRLSGLFENKPFYSQLITTSNDNIGLSINVTLYNEIEINKLQIDSILKTVRFIK
jgi:hypothetical protein